MEFAWQGMFEEDDDGRRSYLKGKENKTGRTESGYIGPNKFD